jgi:hypothetical protein
MEVGPFEHDERWHGLLRWQPGSQPGWRAGGQPPTTRRTNQPHKETIPVQQYSTSTIETWTNEWTCIKKIPVMSELPPNKNNSLKQKTETKKAKKVTFDKAAIERKNGKRTKWKPTRRRVKTNPIREVTIVVSFFLFTFILSHVAKEMVKPREDAGNTGSLGKSRSRQRRSDRVTSTRTQQDIPQHSEFQELKESMDRQQIQLEQQQQIIEDQKLQIERLTAELDINEKEEAHGVCHE